MFFDNVPAGPPDNMFVLKKQADSDTHPQKVDLGVGVYRNEQGQCHQLNVVKDVKQHLVSKDFGHDYLPTTGNSKFYQQAARLVFGNEAEVLSSNRVASTQTISGTGAFHLAAILLSRSVSTTARTVYLGTPTWGNYQPMLDLVGMKTQTYRHYDPTTGTVDFDSVLEAIRSAPPNSPFILQACCHNPSSADLSKDQWITLAREIKFRNHLPIFDIAYQGLGEGIDEDAFGIREFAAQGLEMMVCQSFSKNFALYSERVGAIHVVCSSTQAAANVQDQLRFLIRSEFSSAPAFGAQIVENVLSDPSRECTWSVSHNAGSSTDSFEPFSMRLTLADRRAEIIGIQKRLLYIREELFRLLTAVYKTPGDWRAILQGRGLFSPTQCTALEDRYHIYLVKNGRINVSGLSASSIEYFAKSVDAVVREQCN